MARGDARPLSRRETRGADSDMQRDARRISERAFYRARQIGGEYYHGLDPRRRQEVADAGMIAEDQRATANLSPIPVIRAFPANNYYGTPYLDDTVEEF